MMEKTKSIKQGAAPANVNGNGHRPPMSTNARYFPGAYWGPSADWARPDTKTTAARYDVMKFGNGRY